MVLATFKANFRGRTGFLRLSRLVYTRLIYEIGDRVRDSKLSLLSTRASRSISLKVVVVVLLLFLVVVFEPAFKNAFAFC